MSFNFPIKLIGNLVVVRPEKPKRSTVILPDWSRGLKGEVASIGPECTELKGGETVTFGAVKGMEAVFCGAAVRILRETDIDMVLE